jgi:hypothetical protein
MPSQKGKRAKGVQMTEQQPKTTQIIDIVEMQPTQNGSQTPDTAQIEDILQMVDIQPFKRALGENIYLELTERNGSKRVDLRFWKDGTVPTKEGVSLHLDQWKALCNMSDVIDDLPTRVIEKEPGVGGLCTISWVAGICTISAVGGISTISIICGVLGCRSVI